MRIEIVSKSHLDHGLSPEHLAFVLSTLAERDVGASGYIRETLALPDGLAPLRCGLYGPSMGDAPIGDNEARYIVRGTRKHASRVASRPTRPTWMVTVIAGPPATGPAIVPGPLAAQCGDVACQLVDFSRCVLFTAYGGPAAPREPGDSSIASWEELTQSRRFWAQHALSDSV